MKVFLTNTFKRSAKKLYRHQLSLLEKAIEDIQNNPNLGDLKVGDLAGVRVHKVHFDHQLILVAYVYEEKADEPSITLLSWGPHENFYTDLKKQLQ